MGIISEEYILELVKEYAKTPEGKAAISRKWKGSFLGESKGAGTATHGDVKRILKEIKREFAATVATVIPSFRTEGITTTYGEMNSNGYVSAEINVDNDSLRRESLHRINGNLSISRGEGVEDILALFTHGYTLTGRPYGMWVHDGGNMEWVGARMHREPNLFLLNFVNRMNTKYGSQCRLTLGDKYV